MLLKVTVKFRAFGITFGSWVDSFLPPFPIPVQSDRVIYNAHGVKLEIINP